MGKLKESGSGRSFLIPAQILYVIPFFSRRRIYVGFSRALVEFTGEREFLEMALLASRLCTIIALGILDEGEGLKALILFLILQGSPKDKVDFDGQN